jgi:hypothetical protein
VAELTRRERQQLRRLAGEVYETEAHALLGELDASFQEWRAQELASSELLQMIHEFHQRQSRELWSVYQTLRDPEIVARGLARGFLAETDVPAELMAKLRPVVDVFGR